MSNWLLELNGFMPIIVPITEPAVGYGAVAAGVYFKPKKKKGNEYYKPDIMGVGGGYTQNGTWFAGAGYAGFWKDDKIRYRGVFRYGNINLKYYDIGDNNTSEEPKDFTINSFFFLQQVLFRIKENKFLLGGKYVLANTKVTNFGEEYTPEIDPIDFDLLNSGVGLIAEYESFNNILSPSKGVRIHLS